MNLFKRWYVRQKQSARWRRHLGFILLLLLIYTGSRLYTQRDLASGAVPHFSASTLQGKMVDPTTWSVQPVLLYFWATWCPICRMEQDKINDLAKSYRVITVAMNSGGEDGIEQYLLENDLDFPVIVDPDGQLAQRFGVRGVPTGFVIDTEGQIRFKEVGWTSNWGWRIRLNWVAW